MNRNLLQENRKYYKDLKWDRKFEWGKVFAHYVEWIFFFLSIHEIEDNRTKKISIAVMRKKAYQKCIRKEV